MATAISYGVLYALFIQTHAAVHIITDIKESWHAHVPLKQNNLSHRSHVDHPKKNVHRNYLAGTTKLKIGLSIIYFTTTLISSNVSKTDSLTNIAMKQQQITQ